MPDEVGVFSGRLGIRHRDVNYALLNDLADGIIFAHLAQFYALSFADALRAVPIPGDGLWPRHCARPRRRRTAPDRRAFARFFLAAARTAYPTAGSALLSDFVYGRLIDLTAR